MRDQSIMFPLSDSFLLTFVCLLQHGSHRPQHIRSTSSSVDPPQAPVPKNIYLLWHEVLHRFQGNTCSTLWCWSSQPAPVTRMPSLIPSSRTMVITGWFLPIFQPYTTLTGSILPSPSLLKVLTCLLMEAAPCGGSGAVSGTGQEWPLLTDTRDPHCQHLDTYIHSIPPSPL